jgi:hypothetical protein
MGKRKAEKVEAEGLPLGQILSAIQPLISMLILVTGLVVWAFHTFAQISYVEKQYSEIKSSQDALSKMILDGMQQVKMDAHNYSDGNREKILPAVIDLKDGLREVKDSVKSLESRLLVPISATRSK